MRLATRVREDGGVRLREEGVRRLRMRREERRRSFELPLSGAAGAYASERRALRRYGFWASTIRRGESSPKKTPGVEV